MLHCFIETKFVSRALKFKVTSNKTRLTLKTVQPNNISKTHIAIRFNLRHFWLSVHYFCIYCVIEMFLYCFNIFFLCFSEFDGHFSMPKFCQNHLQSLHWKGTFQVPWRGRGAPLLNRRGVLAVPLTGLKVWTSTAYPKWQLLEFPS